MILGGKNILERAADLVTQAQTNLDAAEQIYTQAAPLIEGATRKRMSRPGMVADLHLRDDIVQLVHIAVWRHIQNKPAPTSPVLLHLLISSTMSNALRGDTRAKRRLGALILDDDDSDRRP